jgi:PAS domain S-box-containing protein
MNQDHTEKPDPLAHLGYFAPRFLVLILGVVLSIVCYLYLAEQDYSKALNQIKNQNKQQALTIASNANNRLVVLKSIRSHLETKGTITEPDFSRLSALFLRHYPDILAIEWAPRIPHALRQDFESSLQPSLHQRSLQSESASSQIEPKQENYSILQYESAKKTSPSSDKTHYFPIQYVMPETERHTALGLDLSSIAHWEGLLEKSEKQNTPVASAVTSLQRGGEEHTSSRIFLPVFDNENRLSGFLTMVIELDSFIQFTLQGFGQNIVTTEFYDIGLQGKTEIHTWPHQQHSEPQTSEKLKNAILQETIPFADRQWLVISRPTHRYLKSQQSSAPRNLLLGGLLLTALAYFSLHWSYLIRRRLADKVNKLEGTLDIESRALQNKLIEKGVLSRALEESEQRCRDVIILSQNYTWEADTNYEYTFLSPQAAKIKGVPPKQLAGKNILDCVIDEDREKAEKALKSAYKKQITIELELRFTHPSGSSTTELVKAVPLIGSLGEWVGFRGTGHLLKIAEDSNC